MYYDFDLNGENANKKFNVGINASDVLGLWLPVEKEREVALKFKFPGIDAVSDYKAFLTAIYEKEIMISFPDADAYKLRYKKSSPTLYNDKVEVVIWFDILV